MNSKKSVGDTFHISKLAAQQRLAVDGATRRY